MHKLLKFGNRASLAKKKTKAMTKGSASENTNTKFLIEFMGAEKKKRKPKTQKTPELKAKGLTGKFGAIEKKRNGSQSQGEMILTMGQTTRMGLEEAFEKAARVIIAEDHPSCASTNQTKEVIKFKVVKGTEAKREYRYASQLTRSKHTNPQ